MIHVRHEQHSLCHLYFLTDPWQLKSCFPQIILINQHYTDENVNEFIHAVADAWHFTTTNLVIITDNAANIL